MREDTIQWYQYKKANRYEKIFLAVFGTCGFMWCWSLFGNFEHSTLSSCVSESRDLSRTVLLYAADHDQRPPIFLVPGSKPKLTGWYGAIRSNSKMQLSANCGADQTKPFEPEWEGSKVVSYGMNSNAAEVTNLEALEDPSKSVMLFEVMGSRTAFYDPDKEDTRHDMVSSSGNGLPGQLYASPSGWETRPRVLYADTYLPYRHRGIQVYSTWAGNVKRLPPAHVSPGGSFSAQGCKSLVTNERIRCAKPVSVLPEEKRLTFSMR